MPSFSRPLAGRVAADGTDILRIYRRRLGAWLRTARLEAGLTQRQLGELVGVSSNAVSAWECGRIGFPDERVYELSDALGVAPRELGMILLRHSDPWTYSALHGMDADRYLRAELAAIPDRLIDHRKGP